jgi:anti-sigma regulatory factor (Ser/Thr protein kinase)
VRDAVAEIRLPSLPVSVAQARRFVAGQLEALGLAETSGDPALVTSELVTNAVLHAGGTEITVRVAPYGDSGVHDPGIHDPGVHDRVRVEVVDGSAVVPEPTAPDHASAAGRGLFLVEHFCDEWGVEPTGSGKIVWFVVSAADSSR